jgi:3'-phosphoadenosine 5'-phosphosulfate sulfotransferase (PAPS reductase)/FAD synthetase
MTEDSSVAYKMKLAEDIIRKAIELYKPVNVLLMVSGGHDSVTNAHVSASILDKLKVIYSVYHGDTTIGIKEVQYYVADICELFEWSLYVRRPPNPEDWYDNIVAKHGFPGPTRSAHQFMYRRLKERALRHFVTHEIKSSPHARENVLLLSGVRKDESLIRMGYQETMSKDASRCWVNPIFYWSEQNCKDYMKKHNIPKNPVKEKICISGECLCGAFAKREEYMEIKHAYPEVFKRLQNLHRIATENGHPWDWASGPNEWKKEQKKSKMFMCIGCEKKYEQQQLF